MSYLKPDISYKKQMWQCLSLRTVILALIFLFIYDMQVCPFIFVYQFYFKPKTFLELSGFQYYSIRIDPYPVVLLSA